MCKAPNQRQSQDGGAQRWADQQNDLQMKWIASTDGNAQSKSTCRLPQTASQGTVKPFLQNQRSVLQAPFPVPRNTQQGWSLPLEYLFNWTRRKSVHPWQALGILPATKTDSSQEFCSLKKCLKSPILWVLCSFKNFETWKGPLISLPTPLLCKCRQPK